MGELTTWVRNTLGREIWPQNSIDMPVIPDYRAVDILLHYERELSRGRFTLAQAYERACDDIQGRNHHVSKPQRGKAYRAITFELAHK